jgi:hypothetical protein
MLIGKVGRLAEAQGSRWVVLLEALQAERVRRLAHGKRPKITLVPPVEADVPDFPPPSTNGHADVP